MCESTADMLEFPVKLDHPGSRIVLNVVRDIRGSPDRRCEIAHEGHLTGVSERDCGGSLNWWVRCAVAGYSVYS
jgi:hypothetical protein